jgi:hypothetical protein
MGLEDLESWTFNSPNLLKYGNFNHNELYIILLVDDNHP